MTQGKRQISKQSDSVEPTKKIMKFDDFMREIHAAAFYRNESQPNQDQSVQALQLPSIDDASQNININNEGHLVIDPKHIINKQFSFISFLGQGAFGQVIQVLDQNSFQVRAIKMTKSFERNRETALEEVEIMSYIQSNDPKGESLCVRLINWFMLRDHVCMVLEFLASSMFDFMKRSNFKPFMIDHIRNIAHQMVSSITFIHNLKLAHTDLKPENILFVNCSYDLDASGNKVLHYTDIRIGDFGLAKFEHQFPNTSLIQTREYRAPEVILSLGWDYSADLWSIGCILFEMYVGAALFQAENDHEHLAMIEKSLGYIPRHMVESTRKHQYWEENGFLINYISPDRFLERIQELEEYNREPENKNHENLFDLMSNMLTIDPQERITPERAIDSPFFK